MNKDIQARLLKLVKQKIGGQDTMGNALSDLLCIGTDAAYRRNRGETALTIHEVEKICKHYSISFDNLMGLSETNVLFEYNPTHMYDFSLEGYLEGIAGAFRSLNECTNPTIVMTINNISVFQLLNFPRLTRFRLYFWAKTHLHMEEFRNKLHEEERITDTAFKLGAEILDLYVNIPTSECYDTEFLRGLLRQIQYYANAQLFKDPKYALRLIDDVKLMADHIKAQTELGFKFKHNDKTGKLGNTYDVYLNDTNNADTSFYYNSEEVEGIFLTHNQMNYLNTTDPVYVKETKSILEKQLANSSIISKVNQKERNTFFSRLDKTIQSVRAQIEAD